MGWPSGRPDLGDYSAVDLAGTIVARFSEWLERANHVLLSAVDETGESWRGKSAHEFREAAARVSSHFLNSSAQASTVSQVLRLLSAAMNERVLPAARTSQAQRRLAKEELIEAQQRLAHAAAINPAVALAGPEAREVARCINEINLQDRCIGQIGRERDNEAASAAARIRAVTFALQTVRGGTAISPLVFSTLLRDLVPQFFKGQMLGYTPQEIRDQWDTLTDSQRHAAIAANPLVLGNLDGIPLGWRAKANEMNIRDEIVRLEAEIERLEESKVPADHATDFLFPFLGGSEAQGKITGMRKQIEAYRVMLRPEEYDDDDPESWRTIEFGPNAKIAPYDKSAGWPKGSLVILFDPSKSKIATYHGTFSKDGDIPHQYENVVTTIPGTGTRAWKWNGPDRRGSQMHVAANEHGSSTAVIVWSDGLQPQEADALLPGYAQKMGPKLVKFSSPYIPEHSTYTVVGHSYGATILSQAEESGLTADRILYMAGAGYGQAADGHMISGLDDFPNTRDNPHYAIMARRDPVVGMAQDDPFGIHGKSQTNDPDVIRLETGFLYDRPPSEETKGKDWSAGYLDDQPGSHSTVFNYESTSFRNIIEVITGGTGQGYVGDDFRRAWNPAEEQDLSQNSHILQPLGTPYEEEEWPDVPIK